MFDSLEIMEGKNLETQTEPIPLQDPTSVIDLYTNTEESELLQCLKYLPEKVDDNPLSYISMVKRYTR